MSTRDPLEASSHDISEPQCAHQPQFGASEWISNEKRALVEQLLFD
jgi:hypothetical protein